MSKQGHIVDPDDSTKAIITPSGNMAGTVWIAPTGTNPLDTNAWRHIGFTLDFEPFLPDPRFTLRMPPAAHRTQEGPGE